MKQELTINFFAKETGKFYFCETFFGTIAAAKRYMEQFKGNFKFVNAETKGGTVVAVVK